MTLAWLMVLVLPALITAGSIAILRRTPAAQRFADVPNERSMHVRPTPCVGGLGLFAGALPIAFFHAEPALAAILGCALALAVLSAFDDIRSLPVQVRLPGHALAALVALLAAAAPEPGRVVLGAGWLAFCLVGLAWMTNVFNFMDGVDGMAGGMAVIGFGALAWAAHEAGWPGLAMACAALSSASLAFLPFNFPPARVFLGDAGSVPLGFLAGALGGYGFVVGAWAWWFPVLVFSPFIVDASVTMLQRLLRGERIWHAHRQHHYQRLALAGWPRRRLAWTAYGLMALVSGTALAARGLGGMWPYGMIAAWSLAFLILCIAIGSPRSSETTIKSSDNGSTSFNGFTGTRQE